ncbi:MAG TPA: SDR family oxidoreductase [Firmicutes bacterium]|nr:SDR family oxidoreductase [Bacillota bacterium]
MTKNREEWGKRLVGDRALITGASAGIGKATAIRFAEEGCSHIAIHGRNKERLDEVANLVKKAGCPNVFTYVADLSDIDAAVDMVRQAIKDMDGIDCCINNAGASLGVPFLETRAKDIEFMYQVDFVSPYLIAQEAAKAMIERKIKGCIMFTVAEAENGGLPHNPVYAAVKAAEINLCKSAAVSLAPYGIRVIAVTPGFTDTMSMDRSGEDSARHVRATLPTVMPLGRMATSEDLAATFAFLASEDASYITGTNIVVDGAVTSDAVSVPWRAALQGRLTGGLGFDQDKVEIDPDSERGKQLRS